MKVVRLHPYGMPSTVRYDIAEVCVDFTLSPPGERAVTYRREAKRSASYDDVQRCLKSLRSDQVLIIEASEGSPYFLFAGMTVFGSRRVQRYIAKHASWYGTSADALEDVLRDQSPASAAWWEDRIRNHEAALQRQRASAISDLIDEHVR